MRHTLILISTGLLIAGCGGTAKPHKKASAVNPYSLTCAQIDADKNNVDDAAGIALAKQVPGGASSPTIQGQISAELTIVCDTGNGTPTPAKDALLRWEQENGSASASSG